MTLENVFTVGKPASTEHPTFMGNYIGLVSEPDILEALELQAVRFREFAESIPAHQLHVVHAPYSWTIAEVLGHCTDTERVFSYRALRFAAGDKTPLPGFDENLYAAAFNYEACDLVDLLDEWGHLRRANTLFFSRLNPSQWLHIGTANDSACSVRALAYAMVGHLRHHASILQKRLGIVNRAII